MVFLFTFQAISFLCASWVNDSPLAIAIYLGAIGVSYGLTWTLFYIIFGSYFKDMPKGQLFSIASMLAPGLGPIVLNSISGAIYDQHGTSTNGTIICHGSECYHQTFIISFVFDVVGFALAVFVWRQQKFK